MKRRLSAALGLLLVAVALAQGALPSGANFVATSANPVNTFATAPDFNTVTASLDDPGTPLRGAAALAATAGSDHPLVSVRIQRSPAGAGSWTDECTDTAAPYTCSWDTTGVADGLYDLRAVALDDHGYSRTSAAITDRRVDNTGPSTTLNDPGTPLTGSRTLTAVSTDAGSGVASVLIEYRTSPSGGWTELCTVASGPYSCDWSTAGVADGLYDLRSTATDAAGNSTTSTVVSDRRVDNTAPAVTVTDPGAAVRGTITLQSTTDDGTGTGVNQVLYEHRATGSGGAWSTACPAPADPFSCSFDTAALTDGLYDLRATATDGAGFSTTSVTVVSRRIDNAVPTAVTMTDPGGSLQGTIGLSGTAADAGSGIASVRFQYAPAGTTAWSDACVDSAAPYASCSWDTTLAADGVYDMRAIAADGAGNTTASATRVNRLVDNVVPAVSMTDPGSPLRTNVTLGATASDGSGIASAAIYYKPTSGGAWTLICSDATAPYQCPWNTTAVTDGAYDLQATATDNFGRTATSTVIARQVDNTGPRASTISSTNGGTSGTLDGGDKLFFGYTESIAPGSVVAGWTGTSRTVTITFARTGSSTTAVVTDTASGTTVPIGPITLNGRWVANGGATFAGTMTLSGATLTVDVAALTGGGTRAETSPTDLDWTNTTTIKDVAGNSGVATAVTGTGVL